MISTYYAVASFADGRTGEGSRAGRKAIAKRAGIGNLRTLSLALDRLIARGWIEEVGRPGKSSLYALGEPDQDDLEQICPTSDLLPVADLPYVPRADLPYHLEQICPTNKNNYQEPLSREDPKGSSTTTNVRERVNPEQTPESIRDLIWNLTKGPYVRPYEVNQLWTDRDNLGRYQESADVELLVGLLGDVETLYESRL
ncbi:hypothetical protein [Nocardia sp. NPDC051832]|uniref:hypothetical protein n=1 Tax=Nocardia sp. NPDC051832 TaxID=3155673 RepID=UPI00344550C1